MSERAVSEVVNGSDECQTADRSPDSVVYECRHCRKPLSGDAATPGRDWRSVYGNPFPLGMQWLPREQAYNFALYSKHATKVELLFFRTDNLIEPCFVFELEPLHHKSGPIWHCRIPVAQANNAVYYGYRVDGPQMGSGFDRHAFDGEKLLLDPYARSVLFPPGFDRPSAQQSGPNLGKAPLALLDECQCRFDWDGDSRVRRDSDLVIYELHVRGFTRHESSGLPSDTRGTFQGVIEKIPHLVELGVTAVELMPVFQFDPQEHNYWGYMPLSFFAPHHAYSMTPDSCGQKSEFRRMVWALHQAGIEVILDVVFNHTCEGDERGPTYSLKGIDNSTYYVLRDDADHPYANFSGCGNTLHTANRAVRQLIIDSLRYWASEMHVDGFRFDLASVFTRNSDGSINLDDPPIFAQIASDPVLANVRLIAEPWDAGDGYLLGKRFPGVTWMQWNAQYRDTLQRFVRGDEGLVGEVMTRLYGSSDLFPDDTFHALHPFQSVNYVASHDGFTLYDLVAYDERHNEANGHNNSDGPTQYASNHGYEGDEDVPADVMALRKRQVRNFFCLLMLSNGTPMFRMGDEFLQTQRGNSNPFNQDNDTSWLDWSRLEQHRDIFNFVRDMIAFRKALPLISRFGFWREDVRWFGPDGTVDLSSGSRTLGVYLAGTDRGDGVLCIMINASLRPVDFLLPSGPVRYWQLRIDTGLPDSFSHSNNRPTFDRDVRPTVPVGSRSIMVLTGGGEK